MVEMEQNQEKWKKWGEKEIIEYRRNGETGKIAEKWGNRKEETGRKRGKMGQNQRKKAKMRQHGAKPASYGDQGKNR